MLEQSAFSWGLLMERTVVLILFLEATMLQSSLGWTTYVVVQSSSEVPKHKVCPGMRFVQPALIGGFSTAS